MGSSSFGRNQRLAIGGYGFPLMMSFALVLGGYITGSEWLSMVQVYVPIAMGTTLGLSGAVKMLRKPEAGGDA